MASFKQVAADRIAKAEADAAGLISQAFDETRTVTDRIAAIDKAFADMPAKIDTRYIGKPVRYGAAGKRYNHTRKYGDNR